MASGHSDFTKDSISADGSLREVASLPIPGQVGISLHKYQGLLHHHAYIQTRPLSNPAIPSIYRYKSFVLVSGVGVLGVEFGIDHGRRKKNQDLSSVHFFLLYFPPLFYSFNGSPKISLETQRVWA